MKPEHILGFLKVFFGLLLFPIFVLSNIFLAVAQAPYEKLWPKRKGLFFALLPFILVPWLLNFCLFGLWEKLSK